MARLFNGSDIITGGHIPTLDALNQLTISYWFYTSSFVADAIHVCKFSADGLNGYSAQQAKTAYSGPALDSDLFFTIRNGSIKGGFTEALNLSLNAWHHAVMVYNGNLTGDANRLKAWVDGVQVTLNFTGFTPIPASTGANIGGVAAGLADIAASTGWNGRLERVGIWGIALLDAEAQSLSTGVACCTIQPDQLGVYVPLDRGESPEPSVSHGGGIGIVSSPTFIAGPVLAYQPRCTNLISDENGAYFSFTQPA